jgi:uncharacterized membrane protein YeaQ/YmgE (transglycosylase-associated protein family)
MENLLILLLVGLIAGWLTGKVMRGKGFGVFGDIIIGLLGAVIGNWIFTQLNIGRITSLALVDAILVAFIGAVVLVAVVRLLKRA